MTTWIVLDSTQACYRSFYTMGGLSYRGTPTGIIYGYLGSVIHLQGLFNTEQICHCFDYGRNLREDTYPPYKRNRKEAREKFTPQQLSEWLGLQAQIKALRSKWLKRIGYRNIFKQKGYEGDDMIASVCLSIIKMGDEAIVVSTDEDMYQLLTKRIKIYDPKKKELWTVKRFKNRFGLEPWQWPTIKAIAGCNTDNVKGLKGVGTITAVKYLINGLKSGSVKYELIKKGRKKIQRINLPLVSLPYKGTKSCFPFKDELPLEGWHRVLRELGIRSLDGDK